MSRLPAAASIFRARFQDGDRVAEQGNGLLG